MNKADRQALQLPGYDPFREAGDCTFNVPASRLPEQFMANHLTHVKGEWTGEPFVLAAWQEPIVRNLFGWLRPDGTRRYQTFLLYIPRKGGKTALCAALLNYLFFCDKMQGAEVVATAASINQADNLYGWASQQVLASDLLQKQVRVYVSKRRVVRISDQGYYTVISSDGDLAHGHNLNAAFIDELHALKNAALVDALDTAMGARSQPLLGFLTTAAVVGPSICNETLEYAEQVMRDGTDDSFLPVVYRADIKDDWTDEKVWAKANPGLGVSPKLSYLRTKLVKAQNIRRYENVFKRLYLNIQTEADQRWLDMTQWKACPHYVPADLEGEPCYLGLDLSWKSDLTALVAFFPGVQNAVVCDVWATQAECRGRPEYRLWRDQGLLRVCPGEVIDHEDVRARILELAELYEVEEIAYDPFGASQLAHQLGEIDGFEMISFRQGALSYNEPSKAFEAMVASGNLRHNDNAVLSWMAGNVAIRSYGNGSIMPVKPAELSPSKVDGIMALVMAIGIGVINGEIEYRPDDEDDADGDAPAEDEEDDLDFLL